MPVRLKDGNDPPPAAGLGGVDRRRHLAGVMGVIVHDLQIRRGNKNLKTAVRPAKLSQALADLFHVQPGLAGQGKSAEGVPGVVSTRGGHAEHAEILAPLFCGKADTVLILTLPTSGVVGPALFPAKSFFGGMGMGRLHGRLFFLGDNHQGTAHLPENFPVRLHHRVLILVPVGVFVIGIQQNRGGRLDLGGSSLAFIHLGDEPPAGSPGAGSTERRRVAAKIEARVLAGLLPDMGQHRGGGGLAVGTQHGEKFLLGGELGEHLVPAEARNSPLPCLGPLRVGIRHGGRGDHHLRVANVAGMVADLDEDAAVAKPFRRFLEIGSGHFMAEVDENVRERTHAGAGDPDEVDPPPSFRPAACVKGHGQSPRRFFRRHPR